MLSLIDTTSATNGIFLRTGDNFLGYPGHSESVFLGLAEQTLYLLQKVGGRDPIHSPMVKDKTEIHRGANRQGITHDDGSTLDHANTENSHLGRVNDWREQVNTRRAE